MKISDIYIKKDGTSIIQIDSFAHYIGNGDVSNSVIVFRNIEYNSEFGYGSYTPFNSFVYSITELQEYDLLLEGDKLDNYTSWEEIIEYAGIVSKKNLNSLLS